jgi:FkbM family methyltransferase
MFLIKIIRNCLNLLDYFNQKKIINIIKNKIQNELVVIDVGAHFGETINIVKKNLQFKKIYSFEASPLNFKTLKTNYPNGLNPNIEIYNYALGEKNIEYFINQTQESSSSTINDLNLKSSYLLKKLKILNIKDRNLFSKKIPIKIITLDSFIDEKKIDKIDLLKIDTEGYEFNILKGLLKNHSKIKLIYFEHHYDDMIIKNYNFSDINDLLIKFGFKKIVKNKMLFRKSFEYLYDNQN